MAEKFRFRAFISYSHRDERWAKWLHGALESYRLPPGLVGKPGIDGPVPQYFAPVFRDRDELSSSPDLSEQVRKALEDSASLIVICSPAAADSKWVNEEIRRFRALGRADRIFCLIVDGDPEADNPGERCFPPALFEADEGERHEPLAADARKFGDGKALAKLKLVAGVLGVRLDALRQREAQRRRRRNLGLGLAAVAAVTLAGVAVFSSVEERRQRALAEQAIATIVGLSEALDSSTNVETLERTASSAYATLASLDPKNLTATQRRQSAMTLRQLGSAYMKKRQMDDALRAFRLSRDVLARLSAEAPDDAALLFEKGLAEYYVADALRERGEIGAAKEAMAQYADSMDKAAAADPGNIEYAVEKALGPFNLGVLDYETVSGDLPGAVAAFSQAIGFLEDVLERDPGNGLVREQLPEAYGWHADAQLAVCALGDAVKARLRAAELSRALYEAAPENRIFEQRYAYRLQGLATIYRVLGNADRALDYYERARSEFRQLSNFDRANVEFRWGGLLASGGAAEMRADTGATDSPLAGMIEVRDAMRELLEREAGLSSRQESEYAVFLVRVAGMANRMGEDALAEDSLDEALRILEAQAREEPDSRLPQRRLLSARFLEWEMYGEIPEGFDAMSGPGDAAVARNMNCEVAAVSALAAILRGDRVTAERHTAYLLEQGYFEPDFVRFCRRYELCPEK